MQLDKQQTNVLSNINNTSTEFRISDMNLVMELLTKLYSNPIQTITQEYIANARDVVCVPTDYNGTKMRVCKFKVVQLCKELNREILVTSSYAITDFYDEYSEEEEEMDEVDGYIDATNPW